MDPSSLIGIGLALVAIFGAMTIDGGNPASLIAPGALLLTFGGTFGVSMASNAMRDAKGFVGVIKSALLSPAVEPDAAVEEVVGFAEKARREGVLALEEDARNIEDPFLRKGIELVVDGTDPEELREILEADITSLKSRHKAGAKFFSDMGGFAPTLGIIGTVTGLIHVLQNLSSPGSLGPAISAAFAATLWGVLQANVFWLPIANKLKRTSELEVQRKELLLEGIMSIQGGANPRVVQQRLLSFLSPAEREAVAERTAASKSKAA
jgi:chemotaxis protein MotA